METKLCVNCKEALPLESFGSNKRQKDGLNYYCKPCTNARVREYKKRMRAANPLNPIWEGMIGRCTNPNNKDYVRYGGRGIKVHPEWLRSYDAFSDAMPPRPPGSTLDRIDNDGDYEPGNVRWSTPKEQSNNRRDNRLVSFKGETLTVTQWADRLGTSKTTLVGRLNRMTVEDALTRPVSSHRVLTFNGRTMTLSKWSKETGIKVGTLYARAFWAGWSAERTLTTPVQSRKTS